MNDYDIRNNINHLKKDELADMIIELHHKIEHKDLRIIEAFAVADSKIKEIDELKHYRKQDQITRDDAWNKLNVSQKQLTDLQEGMKIEREQHKLIISLFNEYLDRMLKAEKALAELNKK